MLIFSPKRFLYINIFKLWKRIYFLLFAKLNNELKSILHHKAFHNLTSTFQTKDLEVHVTLELSLSFLSNLRFRLGGNSAFSQPGQYYSELFDEDDEPISVEPKNDLKGLRRSQIARIL